MDHTDIKAQILSIACDKALHQVFPSKTNAPELEGGGWEAFRWPDDGLPFGFDYKGVDIEVHVEMVTRRVKGTAVFHKVPQLTILGICKDGRGHLIADKVLPTERSF